MSETSFSHTNGTREPLPREHSATYDFAETARRRRIVRARWFDAANKISKRRRVEKIVSHLTHIPQDQVRMLCETCKGLDLTSEKFQVRDDHLSETTLAPPALGVTETSFDPAAARCKVLLGSLTDIWSRSMFCPLCNLVKKAAQEQKSEVDLEEHKDFSDATCWASWQLDGRLETFENGKGSTKPKTRRVKLQWTNDELQDSYIVLMPDQRWPLDSFMMGRYVDSSRANLTLIKKWIEICEENHSGCGPVSGSFALPDFSSLRTKGFFGVVDVHRECLTPLPEHADYIALSYTWGSVEKFTTLKNNVRTFSQDRGLSSIMKQLPKAIQDAIQLTKNLEKKYLWVDALCIVQDSEDSWNLNAQIMDQVYGNAFLTICAADNPDASAGLVGLDPSRRQYSQYVEEYKPGTMLMVSHLSETYIRLSNWNTRAWTFQERLLSRRCLLFTRGRVYFQCRATAMSEDIIAEQGGAGWSIELVHSPLQMLANPPKNALRIYTRCVELFNQRRLTRMEDVLAAFNGITNLLARNLDADFIFGLPNSHFDWALLWEPKRVLQRRQRRRRTSSSRSPTSPRENLKFPSWAWSGWIGEVYYNPATMMGPLSNLREWLLNHTWIIWYIRDGHGDLRLVRSLSTLAERHETEAHRDFPGERDARWAGYSGRSLPLQAQPADEFGRPLPTHAGECDGTTFNRTLPDYPFNTSKAKPDARPYPNRPDMQYLQFWTWSAYFWLCSGSDTSRSYGLQRMSVVDRRGDWCGTVVLDTDTIDLDFQTPLELVAMSRAKEFSASECPNWNFYIPVERERSEWDLYYVILVKRDDENIAHRLGLGKVFINAFPNSLKTNDGKFGMAWREFILG